MCQNHDDADYADQMSQLKIESPMVTSNRKQIDMNHCRKCGAPAYIHLRNDEPPFCETCFLSACVHKFRASFGKNQVIRQGERVLVALSGGASSSAMLQLIQQCLSQSEHRKLRFTPILFHIDESIVFPSNSEAGIISQCVKAMCEKSPFPLDCVCLEQCVLQYCEADKELQILFDKVKGNEKETERKDLLHILMERLLVCIAMDHSCTRILTGDCCSRLSERMLSLVIHGCGDQSCQALSFCDNRLGKVSIIRPMREFFYIEIEHFNLLQKSNCMPTAQESSTVDKSIDWLTKSFLSSLQPDFPSTTHTVFRTGQKLIGSNNNNNPSTTAICRLCKNTFTLPPTDPDLPCAWNALRQSYALVGRTLNTDTSLCIACLQRT